MLLPVDITASLCSHWADRIADDLDARIISGDSSNNEPVPTLYPGMLADTTAWPAWFTLRIDQWEDRTTRGLAADLEGRRSFTTIVHVAVTIRMDDSPERLETLVAVARRALAGQLVYVHDGTGMQTGFLRLREAAVQPAFSLPTGWRRQDLLIDARATPIVVPVSP